MTEACEPDKLQMIGKIQRRA